MPSDSPSQSVSSAISGRRSTIALFIPGISTRPLPLFKLSMLLVYLRSISLQENCMHEAASTAYSSHQFQSLILHVKSQECPQTARRNQSHQQSVEGEVQLRFSSQAFQPVHSLSSSLACYWSTCDQYRSKRIACMKQQALPTVVTSFNP